jgi:Protein of unknown function (DUF2911)
MLKIIYYILIIGLLFASCKNKSDNANKTLITDSLKDNNVYIKPDVSVMDMSWCPTEYPTKKMQGDTTQKLIAKLLYSRPLKKGRSIFGSTEKNLCEYGKPWRLGANEASEITFFENVTIANQQIAKGTYVIYCIPQSNNWTIILNSDLNTWGLHIDSRKDVYKILTPVLKQEPNIESFTMVFEETRNGSNLIMAWDNVKAILPIVYNKQ